LSGQPTSEIEQRRSPSIAAVRFGLARKFVLGWLPAPTCLLCAKPGGCLSSWTIMTKPLHVLRALSSLAIATNLSACEAGMGKQVSYIASRPADDPAIGTVPRGDLTNAADVTGKAKGYEATGYHFDDSEWPEYHNVAVLGGTREKLCFRFVMESSPSDFYGEYVKPYFEQLKTEPLLFVGAFASLQDLEGSKPWPTPNARAEITSVGSEAEGHGDEFDSHGEFRESDRLDTLNFVACVPPPTIASTSQYLALTFPRYSKGELGERRIVLWKIAE
jgi:hypothetical protein